MIFMHERVPSGERAAFKLSSPITRWLDFLIRMLTETSTTLAEFVSSTTLIFLGLLMLQPFESGYLTREVLSQTASPLTNMMLALMRENAWGALFLVFGVFQAVANLSRSFRARRLAAFCCGLLFTFIGLLGVSVRPVSLFGAMCKVHAIGQGLVYLTLGVRGSGAR